MNNISKKKSRILLAIIKLRISLLPVMIATLLPAIIFSVSCDPASNESGKEFEEGSLPNIEGQLPESNNYQGLRFETTKLESSSLEDSLPRVVCLGDSVTFGWNIDYEKTFPYLLEKKLQEKYPGVMVINSGIGGQTVVDGLERLESDVFYFEPQLVIINFGLNDAFIIMEEENNSEPDESLAYEDEEADFRSNIDLGIFKETYGQLIEEISGKGLEILIMGTNPVIAELMWEETDIAEKQEKSYKLYNQASKNIAEEYGLVFLNIWEDFIARGELDILIQPDGVHPSEAGLDLMSEIVFAVLGSADLDGKE